jgi:hypothetical protein
MSALDDLHSGENASWRVSHAQRAEAEARGVSHLLIEQEQLEAEAAYRKAEQARVNALVSDPATLAALRRYWAPRPIAPDGSVAPRLPDPLAPPPAPPAPPAWKVAADQANAERLRARRWRDYVAEHPHGLRFDGTRVERDPRTPPEWFQ